MNKHTEAQIVNELASQMDFTFLSGTTWNTDPKEAVKSIKEQKEDVKDLTNSVQITTGLVKKLPDSNPNKTSAKDFIRWEKDRIKEYKKSIPICESAKAHSI